MSVDYLAKPRAVFRDLYRCLKPGGSAIISFSNRMFPTKAINAWLSSDNNGRIWIVANYFKHTGFVDIEAYDLIQESRLNDNEGTQGTDPMFVVVATRPLTKSNTTFGRRSDL